MPAERRIDILDMQVRKAHSGKEGVLIQQSKIIIPVSSGDEAYAKASGGDTMGIIVDIDQKRMNNNAEKRRDNK